MVGELSAIQTRYQGCRFRSRLEARWAVFFDSLGIEWRYEPEGFAMWSVTWYLPDFYLPRGGWWIEIKGKEPNEDEIKKNFDLFLETYDHDVGEFEETYIFYGDIPWPYPEKGNIVGQGVQGRVGSHPGEEGELGDHWNLCWQECPVCSSITIGRLNDLYCSGCFEGLLAHVSDYVIKNGNLTADREILLSIVDREFFTSSHESYTLRRAYEKARSARFEHGEAP